MRIPQMSYLLLAHMGYIVRGQGVQRLDERVYVSLLREHRRKGPRVLSELLIFPISGRFLLTSPPEDCAGLLASDPRIQCHAEFKGNRFARHSRHLNA